MKCLRLAYGSARIPALHVAICEKTTVNGSSHMHPLRPCTPGRSFTSCKGRWATSQLRKGRTSLPAASPCGATSLCPHDASFRRPTRVKTRKSRARPGFTCKTSLHESLAFVSGICFDRQCQEAADRAFLTVTLIPLLGLFIAIILRFRPAAAEDLDSDQVHMACLTSDSVSC